MSSARELLDHLAGTTIYVNGAEYSADAIEPKTFTALRAVLDNCDFIDCLIAKYEPHEIAGLIRETITRELGGKP